MKVFQAMKAEISQEIEDSDDVMQDDLTRRGMALNTFEQPCELESFRNNPAYLENMYNTK